MQANVLLLFVLVCNMITAMSLSDDTLDEMLMCLCPSLLLLLH